MDYKINLGVGWRGGYEVINGVGKKKNRVLFYFIGQRCANVCECLQEEVSQPIPQCECV